VARVDDPARGVEFALDSFELADGRLVVAGRWYGVSGRRFVRPVLQAPGQRRVIAVLDHKPWSADEGAPWLAAFPGDGVEGPSRLQVAPDIAVELPEAGPDAGDGVPRPARLIRPPAAPEAEPAPEPGRERRDAGEAAEIEAMRRERDAARAEADRLRTELDHARKESERVQTELDHALTDADHLRTELSHVRAQVNALGREHEEAQAKAERLEADATRLRADAHRAASERAAAQTALERLRRTPATSPYIAPRPMAFRDPEPGRGWPVRAIAFVLVLGLLAALVQLLFGVL
jgi:hypothetical protein